MKNNKLEEKFNQFNSMTPEQIEELINFNRAISFEKIQEIEEEKRLIPLQKEVEEVAEKIAQLELSLKEMKDEAKIGKTYIEIANLKAKQKQLVEQQSNEKKKIDKEVKEDKKDKVLLEGFSKNKEKILKIRNYKSKIEKSIEEKMKQSIAAKTKLEKLTNLKKKIEEKLNDPTKTENLTNNEYNYLLESEEKIKQEIEKANKLVKELEKSISAKNEAISKCDLAWKSLFYDKTWDEIHVRAMNAKYTRKVKEINQNENNKSEIVETKNIPYKSQEMKMDDNNVKYNEENRIVKVSTFAEKHPRVSKFFNWCKKGIDKVWGTFKKEPIEYRPLNSEEYTLNNSNIQEEKKEEIQENNMENNIERDAFIEELRRHIENDKSDKELAYIEQHKAKVKKQEDVEKEF